MKDTKANRVVKEASRIAAKDVRLPKVLRDKQMKNNKTINMDKLSNLEKQQLLLLLNKIEDGDIIKIGEKYFTIKQLG